MKNEFDKIVKENRTLNFKEAKEFIYSIAENKLNDAQLIAIIVIIQSRGYTIEELKGFRIALLELATPLQLDNTQAIDLCGTGGDGKNTFNISTTTSFVLASMGYKVIKHGNYGVSSMVGSSNVLEALGITFTSNENELQDQLEKNNICFLHAPLFHPTLKNVAHIRKELGIKTFFNSLGPLINPVQPNYQLTGTFSLELAKIYHHILQENRKEYRIIYGLDGYDEITLTDYTTLLGKNSEQTISATQFNIENVKASALFSGNTLTDAKNIILNILNSKGTKEQTYVVAANSAVALQCYHPEEELLVLFKEALNHINSGKVNTKFNFK